MALLKKLLRSWAIPLALLVAVGLSYGVWIPWLGLYGDDLPYLWYYHLLGPWGPGEFAAMDRPASALFYAAATLAFGENVWLYHIFLLVLRWLSGLLLWWVLRLVWPERGLGAAVAALLFVVYPGFRQSPVALEFILHIAVLDLFLVSLGSTMQVAISRISSRAPSNRLLWAAISLVTAAGPFLLEYFVGLEILRPLLLWIVLQRQGIAGRKRWSSLLRAWLPALGVVLAFLVWRVFVFSFRTYQPVLLDQLRASPLDGLLQLGLRAAGDLWTSLVGAWKLAFQLPQGRRALMQSLAVSAACAAVVGLLLWRLKKTPAKDGPGSAAKVDFWGETMLAVGLVAMLAGGSIFWLTGIQVTTEFPWDRSTLSFMLGASLAGAGLLEMVATPRYRLVLAALLVGLAAGAHYQNAQVYRAEWKKLQSFFWQLTWRAPDLEPGTLLLFDVIPLNRYSDNDLTALLNWTYAPDLNTRQIPYKFFDLTIRLETEYEGLPGVEKGLPVEHNHRGLYFSTTTSNTLAVHYDPPGCLIVPGPEDTQLPGLPERLARVLPITRLDQIRVGGNAARPPSQLGEEPAHDWCFYYQKAGLALQQGDWQEIASLGQQAEQAGLHWNAPAELLPFIEGYARGGDLQKAQALTAEAGQDAGMRPSLCAAWQKIGQQDGDLGAVSAAVQADLGCAP